MPIIPIKFYLLSSRAFKGISAKVEEPAIWIVGIWTITLEADLLCIGNKLRLVRHRSVSIVPGIQILSMGFILIASYLRPKANAIDLFFVRDVDIGKLAERG